MTTQLTCAELREDIKNGRPVRLTIYTGRIVRGYSETHDHYFHTQEHAREFAAAKGAANFNLYGWDGRNWSTDAL